MGSISPLFEILREALLGFDSISLTESGENSRALKAIFRSSSSEPIRYGFDQLSDGQRALIAMYILTFLMFLGSDESPIDGGNTPLHNAASKGEDILCRYLIFEDNGLVSEIARIGDVSARARYRGKFLKREYMRFYRDQERKTLTAMNFLHKQNPDAGTPIP